jgi:2-dehydro-3-deoxygluconokinase
MNRLDAVTFGEAMAMFIANEPGELYTIEQFTRKLAGAETNVAIGLARLSLRVGLMSKIGDDAFGRFVLNAIQQEGVNTEQVLVDKEHPTGFQLKSKVLNGDPQVQYFRKGSAASTMSRNDFDPLYFASARHLHMTGIPPALSNSARDFAQYALISMKNAGRTVSFDPNLRPSLWCSQNEMIHLVNELASQADWVFPGLSEGEILTGFSNPRAIADFYLDRGVKLAVIKLGPGGAYYSTGDEEGEVAGFSVKQVVDTVGAGDGFAVGMISALLEGLPVKEAVERANAIGALAVMSPGDMDGLPTRQELLTFMGQQHILKG